jgi:hypothetical protein
MLYSIHGNQKAKDSTISGKLQFIRDVFEEISRITSKNVLS